MGTHVREAGDAERPTLVLVHGAGQGGRMWRRQLEALSDSYHVIAPDLPGFGGTPGPFSLSAAIESVTGIARQLRPAHLCGHSLGAIVAARVAAEKPDLVARLILSGGPEIAPGRTSPRRFRLERHRPGWLVRAMTDLSDRTGGIDLLDALRTSDLSPVLPHIAAPALVLCGERDRASLPDARRTVAAIPGAHLSVVPHAGHLLPTRRRMPSTPSPGASLPPETSRRVDERRRSRLGSPGPPFDEPSGGRGRPATAGPGLSPARRGAVGKTVTIADGGYRRTGLVLLHCP